MKKKIKTLLILSMFFCSTNLFSQVVYLNEWQVSDYKNKTGYTLKKKTSIVSDIWEWLTSYFTTGKVVIHVDDPGIYIIGIDNNNKGFEDKIVMKLPTKEHQYYLSKQGEKFFKGPYSITPSFWSTTEKHHSFSE